MDTQPTFTPITTPVVAPEPQHTEQQSATPNGSLQTEITYSVGLLARPVRGRLTYDGSGLVQLIDTASNAIVFSKQIQELGRVTRAEYAIYMNVPGMKKVTVMFGNAKRYLTENAVGMQLGVAGAVGGVVRSNSMNKASGLESWVAIFKANGKINNLSPNSVVLFAVIGGVVIVLVAGAISYYIWQS